jgi:hypothetical protein
MSEQMKTTEATLGAVATAAPAAQTARPTGRVMTDPRQVAALVMAQSSVVNAKKDELTIAIKALTDVAQQLGRAYVGQMQVIQHLAQRVKVLEAKTGCATEAAPKAA